MTDARSDIAARASQALRTAEKLERRRAFDRVDAHCKAREAAQLRAEGQRLLTPPDHLTGDARLELVPALADREAAALNPTRNP
jgi:hypothetical protein